MQKCCTALYSAWAPKSSVKAPNPWNTQEPNSSFRNSPIARLGSVATYIPARPPAHRHALHWKSFPSHRGFRQLPENSHKNSLWKEPYKTGGRRNMKAGKRPLTNTSKDSEPPTVFPRLSTARDVLQLLKPPEFVPQPFGRQTTSN